MKSKYIFELEDGWYHRTEDDDIVGPFKTQSQAQIALDAYLKWLNHDHENDIHKMRDNMGW
jgi:hypothetical protein